MAGARCAWISIVCGRPRSVGARWTWGLSSLCDSRGFSVGLCPLGAGTCVCDFLLLSYYFYIRQNFKDGDSIMERGEWRLFGDWREGRGGEGRSEGGLVWSFGWVEI